MLQQLIGAQIVKINEDSIEVNLNGNMMETVVDMLILKPICYILRIMIETQSLPMSNL